MYPGDGPKTYMVLLGVHGVTTPPGSTVLGADDVLAGYWRQALDHTIPYQGNWRQDHTIPYTRGHGNQCPGQYTHVYCPHCGCANQQSLPKNRPQFPVDGEIEEGNELALHLPHLME